MAIEEVINLRTKTEGAASVKSLKQEIRETQAEAIKAARAFGEFSPEATKAAKRVAQLKDEMGDFQQRVAALNPDRFQAIAGVTQGIANGISAATGAMALFGAESEDVQKTLAKVQGAIAFSQGVQGILNLKNAIGGFGAAALAVGTILAATWGKIKTFIDGVSNEQERLNELSEANLETQNQKLESLDKQDNILKLQGKSELEILRLKESQSAEAIKAAEVTLQNAIVTKNAQVEAAKRNQEILKGIITFITAPLQLLLATIDQVGTAIGENFGLRGKFNKSIASLIFDPEEVASEGDKAIAAAKSRLEELKNLNAGYKLQITDTNNQIAAEIKTQREDAQKEQEDFNKAIAGIEDAFSQANINRKQKEADEVTNIADKFAKDREEQKLGEDARNAYWDKKKQKGIDDNIEAEKDLVAAKQAGYDATSQLLGNLSQLFAQGSAEQKAFAVAQVLVDEAKAIASTIAGATAAAAAGGPAAPFLLGAYITAGLATVAANFKRVKDILNTPTAAAPQNATPPQFNPVSSSGLPGSDEVAGQMKDMKVYVLEGDITKTQGRVQRNNSLAVI